MEAALTHTKTMVNGVTLHAVQAGPADGAPVILLHGFPEFWWGWRRQLAPLADAGYRVIVPDLRGYNMSDAPQDVAAYHLDTLVADVLALADALGAPRFHLVGHDWGGVIAWALAGAHGERLERLVVMDAPHPDLWLADVMHHPTQALRSSYVAFFQLPWVPEATLAGLNYAGLRAMLESTSRPGTFAHGDIERYVQAWSHPGAVTAMLNYYRALRLRAPVAQPPRIATPTLVLWGGKDGALERRLAHKALDLCDDGRLEVLEEATHWLHLEEPARVNAALIGFLGDTTVVSAHMPL